ncbi:MAG: methyltransferase domain-containing protein, partial [Candidatus Omnitrophica bacterium]|nr:methyltransferase domain-containing protein [Candidatus Omnitrophota bacterium]
SKFWANYFRVYDVLNLLIPYQELLDTICDELGIKKGEKILEAGCGTGNLAIKIKERGGDVIGLDNCKEALEIYKKKDPNAKTVLADLREKLPFPDNYFDKIASNNTLYIIPKEKQLDTLKEFYRILKPGGKIIIANPREKSKIYKIYTVGVKSNFKKEGVISTFKKLFRFLPETIKIFYYNHLLNKECLFLSEEELNELLKTAGFKKLSNEKLVYANQNILLSAEKIL